MSFNCVCSECVCLYVGWIVPSPPLLLYFCEQRRRWSCDGVQLRHFFRFLKQIVAVFFGCSLFFFLYFFLSWFFEFI